MTNLKTLSAAMAFVLSMLSASPLYAQSTQQPTLTPYQKALKAAAEEAVDYLDEATLKQTEEILKKISPCKAAVKKLAIKQGFFLGGSLLSLISGLLISSTSNEITQVARHKTGSYLAAFGFLTLVGQLFFMIEDDDKQPVELKNWSDFPQEEKWETIALFSLMEAGLPHPDDVFASQKINITLTQGSQSKRVDLLNGKITSYIISASDLRKSHEKINADMLALLNKHCPKK